MEKKTILIYVSGGVVQHVTTDDMNIRVLLADMEWIEAGAPAPASPIVDLEMLNRGKEALTATLAGITQTFQEEVRERSERAAARLNQRHPLCIICEQRIMDSEWITDADGNASADPGPCVCARNA